MQAGPNEELPNRILELRLRRAIMEALHELVPEFHAHVGTCASCGRFHEWLRWTHREGTNEWHTACPMTGAQLTLPFQFNGGAGDRSAA